MNEQQRQQYRRREGRPSSLSAEARQQCADCVAWARKLAAQDCRRRRAPWDHEETLSAALEALTEAALAWDPTLGRLTTFATVVINRALWHRARLAARLSEVPMPELFDPPAPAEGATAPAAAQEDEECCDARLWRLLEPADELCLRLRARGSTWREVAARVGCGTAADARARGERALACLRGLAARAGRRRVVEEEDEEDQQS